MNKSTLTVLLLFFNLTVLSQIDTSRVFQPDSIAIDTSLVIPDSSDIQSSDSLQAKAKKDTLRPLSFSGYSSSSLNANTLTRSQIDKKDYRYAGDIFNYFPFGYNVDLGAIGNPSELFVNGLGWGNISYMQNGIPINNRFQNALDLNSIQTEIVDSIETPSLASGFLFNNYNNPVSVNLITRTKVSPRPYSRIKFYQAPENEGIFSGMFSAYLIKRVNIGFSLANQSADPRYENSELSNWQFNANARYMPSNELNFLLNYDYSKMNMGLNGGVDANATPPDLIFDNVQADVNYLNRYHKVSRHNFSLSTLVEFDSTSYTNLTLYYQYNLNEFRLNESTTDSTDERIKNDNSYKSYGINLYHKFNVHPFSLDIIANYERNEFDVDYNKNVSSFNLWSVGGKLNANILSDKIVPSLFVKTSGLDDNLAFGFGGELKFDINDWLNGNAGISKFKRNVNPFISSGSTNDVTILEAGLTSQFSFAKAGITYFNIEQTNYPIGLLDEMSEYYPNSTINNYDLVDFQRSGFNVNLSIKLWKFLLQTNTSFYFNESDNVNRELPAQTSFGGIYYVDTLFNNNLDLKTGLNYKFYGERGAAIYDFQKMQTAYYFTDYSVINPINSRTLLQNDYQLDLFISGTIRKRAIVYIVFENLLNEQYYIVPYYPMQPSGLRLGVAWEFLD